MKVYKTYERLVARNKAGDKKYWEVIIKTPDDENYYIVSAWWQITKTGNESIVQESVPYFASPTNVGKANARNSREQAEFEAEALIKKQRDKNFRWEDEPEGTEILPMLAHKYKDHKHKLKFPVFVQPKLNGMRMLFNGKNGTSRGNKPIISEVVQHLQCELENTVLDGELILPNNVLLQETMKAAKKFRPGVSDTLLYYVYDFVGTNLPYDARYDILKLSLQNTFAPNMVLTPTFECNSEEEIMEHHHRFTKQGYEGTMVRSADGKYEINKRSYSLLKLKDMTDSEFKIIDVVDGGGKDVGLAIFVCETENGEKIFNCRPEGSEENRRELFNNKEQYIGKYLTIRYQELSNDAVPLFPVGVCVRDETDFK